MIGVTKCSFGGVTCCTYSFIAQFVHKIDVERQVCEFEGNKIIVRKQEQTTTDMYVHHST